MYIILIFLKDHIYVEFFALCVPFKICDPACDLVPSGGNVYFLVDEFDFHVVKTICKYSL